MELLKQALAKLSLKDRTAVERSIEQVDPLTHAPSLRDRAMQGRVLMINAGRDEVIPRRCTEELAKALGISDRVVWLEGLEHYTAMAALPRALDTTATFFAQDLPPDAKRTSPAWGSDGQRADAVDEEEPASLSPVLRFIQCVQQLGVLLDTNQNPNSGRGHLMDVDLRVTLSDGERIQAESQVIRGEGDWDGMPMSFLMRDIMERADSVDEALRIIRDTPLTCEYYYVISDRSGEMVALECMPGNVTVLRPGEQHPRLPEPRLAGRLPPAAEQAVDREGLLLAGAHQGFEVGPVVRAGQRGRGGAGHLMNVQQGASPGAPAWTRHGRPRPI